jgi:hypothetical protein
MITDPEPRRPTQVQDIVCHPTTQQASNGWDDGGGPFAAAHNSERDPGAASGLRTRTGHNGTNAGATRNVDLTVDEVRILRGLLDHRISDLGAEIHHTRTPDYHDALKVLRDKLKTLDRELAEASTKSW